MNQRIWVNADGLRCVQGSELIDDDGCWLDEMEYNQDDFHRDYPQGEPEDGDRLEKLSEMIAKIEEDSAKATKRTEEMIAALQSRKDPQPHYGVLTNQAASPYPPNSYHDDTANTDENAERIAKEHGLIWDSSKRLFRHKSDPYGYWGSPGGVFDGIWPLLKRLAKPLPCLSVWAGMTATFFWNSLKNLPEQPFEGIVDLPDGTPEQAIAAGLQTAVFLLWTTCFKLTIQQAVRREFESH